jgi:SsrA-binding protein
MADLVSNRRASHDYEILETYEAGIVLCGTEIKSLRNNGGNLQEGYIKILGDEVWLVGCHIAPYEFGNMYNHEERRDRKLLMHKREIEKLKKATQEKGLALVPMAMYLKKGRVKVKIGRGKGRKSYDKREAIKKKESNRQIQQMLKHKQQ